MTPDEIMTHPRRMRVYHAHIYRRAERLSYAETGEQLGVTRNTVAGYERDYRRWYEVGVDDPAVPSTAAPDVRETGVYPAWTPGETFQPVDQRRAALQAYLGTTYRVAPFAYTRHTSRVVVGVGDFHGQPDPAVVAELVKARADIYVIAGDTLDNQPASAHAPETKEEALRRRAKESREEFANLRAMFEVLISETSGNVKVFDGNHDQWIWRKMADLLPAYLLDYFIDPMDMLLEGLSPRVERVVHTQCFHYPNGSVADDVPETRFMYVLGDCLFSHKNFCGKHPGQGVLRLFDWFAEWKLPLGLDHIRCAIQFHGHKRAMLNRSGGWYTLIEPGMGGTTATEGYKVGYQSKWQPSVQGFVRLEQYQDANHDWHTDTPSIAMVAPRLAQRGRVV